MADDGWEDVTDPAEIRKVTGGRGRTGMSVQESKEIADARKANQDGRNVFHDLANLYRTASKYPGGIPNNIADSWKATLGAAGDQVQTQQLFKAQAGQQAVGQAKLLAPVSNTDLQGLINFGPNPSLRIENNKQLIGQRYEEAARRYFENAFKQRWAAKNGGLNGTGKDGRTYAEALSQAMKRPDVAQELLAPWKRQSIGSPAPAKQWKVIR